jgi:hypothetical protein
MIQGHVAIQKGMRAREEERGRAGVSECVCANGEAIATRAADDG